MKRTISLIVVLALVYFGYQLYSQNNENPEEFSITGEVKGSVMLLGKSFIEVVDNDNDDKYYVYSEDCCPEKGDTYTFQIKSSELARVNDKSLTLYTESSRMKKR